MARLFPKARLGGLRWAIALLGALAIIAATTGGSSAAPWRPLTRAVTAKGTLAPESNLPSGSKWSFDGSTGGWVAFNGASLADVSSPVQAGTGALSVTNNGGSTVNEWVGSGGNRSSWTAATGNQTYTASAFLRAGSTGRTVGALLVFYDANGSQLASASGQTTADAAGTWTSIHPVVAVAPANSAFVALGLAFYGTAAGEVHYVDSASLTATTGEPRALVGTLHTNGNKLVDGTDNPVTLRGVFAGFSNLSAAKVPSDAVIGGIQRWRANLVRVPLAESLWLNTCPTGTATNDPAYPSAIDAEVQSITGRGMVALLALQNNVISPCGASFQHRMADANYSIPFWQQVASRYKSNGLVAFDLYNEPHVDTGAIWRNGGMVTEGTVSFNAAGMQQMLDAIRATGATNVVTVSGNNYAGDPSPVFQGYGVSGINIVYALHAYTCPHDNDPSCPTNPANQTQHIDSRWSQIAQYFPVVVTEFGFPDRSNGSYNDSVIRYAESQGWGWSTFMFVPVAPNGPFDLNVDSGPNFEPQPSAMPVLAGLTAN